MKFLWLFRRIFRVVLSVFLIGILASLQVNSNLLLGQDISSNLPFFDPETQHLIQKSPRVVFLIPFSHWDTDWHQSFAAYSKLSDQNIIKAIQLAKQYPRFRYTMEQVLFVQHFWDTHPEYHDELKTLVQNRQISFAWAGITQPETSLVAPAVQVRNLQLGQTWIAQTFGTESVPHSAWQSDAFGNSAAFPTFLAQANIPYLYIGRYQGGCDPDYQQCQPLPPAFYWTSPASSAGRVLVAYNSYPTAWYNIYHNSNPNDPLADLRASIEKAFKQTDSKYLFMPLGFDFFDQQSTLPALVDQWNATDHETALVMSDTTSAFQYLATQPLPEITTDLNPIWQAFYDTRPAAKIADKESEYYLSAADKFGAMLDAPSSSAWNSAAINAHYDNISGVSFDSVWETSQHPRFDQTVATAKDDLATILAHIASRVSAPVVIFNPTSWPRSEVIELNGNLPNDNLLPKETQKTDPDGIAFQVNDIPALGYRGLTDDQAKIDHPTQAKQDRNHFTLANGLVSVTVDADHGGTFSNLTLVDDKAVSQELLSTFGDDVLYRDDSGDVYGAHFGQEHGREGQTSAQVTILTSGPLIARLQIIFTLSGQQVTKIVTLKADSPVIAVDLYISALPETTALVEMPTVLGTTMRTDDLGFGAFTHVIDTKPIVSGDVTYRRSIFYPNIYWNDVSNDNIGLTIITHGLQGVAGSTTRGLMLVRDVTRDKEGVTDLGMHHLRYAYLPHIGTATDARSWLAAYEFNQPLIASWHQETTINLQLPFDEITPIRQIEVGSPASDFPLTSSLMSSENAVIADVYRAGDQTNAVVINYDPSTSATIQIGNQKIAVPPSVFAIVPLPSPASLEK